MIAFVMTAAAVLIALGFAGLVANLVERAVDRSAVRRVDRAVAVFEASGQFTDLEPLAAQLVGGAA